MNYRWISVVLISPCIVCAMSLEITRSVVLATGAWWVNNLFFFSVAILSRSFLYLSCLGENLKIDWAEKFQCLKGMEVP